MLIYFFISLIIGIVSTIGFVAWYEKKYGYMPDGWHVLLSIVTCSVLWPFFALYILFKTLFVEK